MWRLWQIWAMLAGRLEQLMSPCLVPKNQPRHSPGTIDGSKDGYGEPCSEKTWEKKRPAAKFTCASKVREIGAKMSDLIITIGPKAIMTPVSFVNRVVKEKQTCFYLASFNTNTIPWCICFLPRCICFPLFWSPESPRWRSSTRATSFPRVFVAVHWKRTVSAWHVQANKYKYKASSIKQIQIQRRFYNTVR